MKPYILLVSALLALLAGCADHDEKGAATGKNAPPAYMLYSPNGEPLNGGPLGKPTCEQALSNWFGHIGENGKIGKDAFLADARTQFSRMDIDHNGYIVSEELDRYREPYRQQPPAQKKEEKDADAQDGEKHAHKGKSRSSENANPSDLSFTTADPVMSADTNLDFKVTPDEFMKQADDIFARLDMNHDGFLDRTEIMAQCQEKKP